MKAKAPKLITSPYKQKQFILRQREKEVRRGTLVASSKDIKDAGLRLSRNGEIIAADSEGKPICKFNNDGKNLAKFLAKKSEELLENVIPPKLT